MNIFSFFRLLRTIYADPEPDIEYIQIHGGKRTTRDCYQTLFLPSNCRSHLRRRGSSFLLSQAPGKRILFAWWAED
jgi:hypothetical protein